jgi:branched-chain amino acid transport system substrate-binding protein
MTLKSLGVLVLVAALLLSSIPVGAQGPIRIGASLSLTGTYAQPGRYQHEGYKLCEKDLNAKGGLLGRKVELVVYDDQSMPATGVRLYEKLITDDKVDAVMGPYSSAVSEAVANVTEKYKKVMVAPLAATTEIFKKGRRYAFMILSPAEVYLEGLVDIAAKRGLKTIAIINEDTLFPKASAAGTADLAKKAGLDVVFREAYPKGNQDYSAMLTKIKAAKPDVLAAATYFDDAVAIARQMKELDVNPKMFAVTVGGDIPKFYDLLKQTSEYHLQREPVGGRAALRGRQGVLRDVQEGVRARAELPRRRRLLGLQCSTRRRQKAGTLDADKVRDVLLATKVRTLFGDYQVDKDGFQTAHKMVLLQWQDGKRTVVWPDELANGKARFRRRLEPAIARPEGAAPAPSVSSPACVGGERRR